MSDPISTTIAMSGGETAILTTEQDAEVDPSSPGDYEPLDPLEFPVVGVTGRGKVLQEAMDAGCSAVFTISATALPIGLQGGKSRLAWRGIDYLVQQVRERRWRGEINGYSLFLVA